MEYDTTPNNPKFFTKRNLSSKSLDNDARETVLDELDDVGFFNNTHSNGLKSARMKHAIKRLGKVIERFQNCPFLLSFQNRRIIRRISDNVNDNDNVLEGQIIEKIIIPSNIFDMYTRFDILPGLKLSGHTNILTEASNLIDEIYKRREIQNEQQYRNAFDKFYTQ